MISVGESCEYLLHRFTPWWISPPLFTSTSMNNCSNYSLLKICVFCFGSVTTMITVDEPEPSDTDEDILSGIAVDL